jgi:uncharacterized coiled-coil protein SlyX
MEREMTDKQKTIAERMESRVAELEKRVLGLERGMTPEWLEHIVTDIGVSLRVPLFDELRHLKSRVKALEQTDIDKENDEGV